ncbi:hypothetical protein FAZ79_00340 [Guyparkeria sp. SB14A]|uniref:hypothetical protein n=1 Tax=Guyparkeria sp. SB14A TaxID=2571147 RepID=UPI0010AD6F4D|nr:hypothetical protein [Guyparkeria sp. SB14A]TKA91788.1 hypothetical protein FAZ79_00340 [Guyparkeria sp. SB14A]
MTKQPHDAYKEREPGKPVRFNVDPDQLHAAMEKAGDDRAACVLLEDGMPVAAVVVLRGQLTTDYLQALDDEAECLKAD